jgi:hypothetical protein
VWNVFICNTVEELMVAANKKKAEALAGGDKGPGVTPASAEVKRLSRLLRILVQEFRKGRLPVAAGNTKRRKATPKRARVKTARSMLG